MLRSFIPDARRHDQFRSALDWALRRHPALGGAEINFAPQVEGMPALRVYAWLFEERADVLVVEGIRTDSD